MYERAVGVVVFHRAGREVERRLMGEGVEGKQ